MQLKPVKTLHELVDLLELEGHMSILGLVDLVGEVDQELRIALDDKAFDAKADRSPNSGKEALVLGDVVGDLVALAEAELHCGTPIRRSSYLIYQPQKR